MAATILDLDALMNSTLDNVDEAPEFMDPPAGNYHFVVKDAKINPAKEQGKAAQIVLIYAVVQTLETKEVPVPNGTLVSQSFQGTSQGLEYFKPVARKILNVTDLTGVPVGEILASLKGVEFNATLSYTTRKGKTGTPYAGKDFVNKVFTVKEPE